MMIGMSEPAAHSAFAAPMKYPAPNPAVTPTGAKPMKYIASDGPMTVPYETPGWSKAGAIVVTLATLGVWVWALARLIMNGVPSSTQAGWQWAALAGLTAAAGWCVALAFSSPRGIVSVGDGKTNIISVFPIWAVAAVACGLVMWAVTN